MNMYQLNNALDVCNSAPPVHLLQVDLNSSRLQFIKFKFYSLFTSEGVNKHLVNTSRCEQGVKKTK